MLSNFQTPTTESPQYVGRFAPSPSGPLHLGSLVTALGSYLRAKSQQGKWLLRIDDLDPPREVPGASDDILFTLEQHGLLWDGEPLYQSQRTSHYQAGLEKLQSDNLTYACECTRKQIKLQGPYYSGSCCNKNLSESGLAIRFRNNFTVTSLLDQHLGKIKADPIATSEDFIVKRKDGYYAYHLAAVVDDIFQQVTEIVRGADLLQPTLCQLALYQALGATPPKFLHLPVISTAVGMKLSKQNHAQAIMANAAPQNLVHALHLLGLTPSDDIDKTKVTDILNWAVAHWSLAKVSKNPEIIID